MINEIWSRGGMPETMNYKAHGLSYQPKILMTKIGLDGHDRGSCIVAAYLRDAFCQQSYVSEVNLAGIKPVAPGYGRVL